MPKHEIMAFTEERKFIHYFFLQGRTSPVMLSCFSNVHSYRDFTYFDDVHSNSLHVKIPLLLRSIWLYVSSKLMRKTKIWHRMHLQKPSSCEFENPEDNPTNDDLLLLFKQKMKISSPCSEFKAINICL